MRSKATKISVNPRKKFRGFFVFLEKYTPMKTFKQYLEEATAGAEWKPAVIDYVKFPRNRAAFNKTEILSKLKSKKFNVSKAKIIRGDFGATVYDASKITTDDAQEFHDQCEMELYGHENLD